MPGRHPTNLVSFPQLPVLIGLFVVWYFGPPQVPPILGWAGRKIVNVLGYAGAQHRREVVEL